MLRRMAVAVSGSHRKGPPHRVQGAAPIRGQERRSFGHRPFQNGQSWAGSRWARIQSEHRCRQYTRTCSCEPR